MSEMNYKRTKERTGSLLSLSTENLLSRHTSCACQIPLPLSISRSSFCFILPNHFRGKSSLAKGTVVPYASDRVHGRRYGRCSAIDCVRVSLAVDRCLMVSHQVCIVVALDLKKLTVVEHCRSNHLVNNIVDAFRLMQERKCVCGEQPEIVNFQHPSTAGDMRSLAPQTF